MTSKQTKWNEVMVSLSVIKVLDEDPDSHGYSKQQQNGDVNLAGNLISSQTARLRDFVYCIFAFCTFVFPYVFRKIHMEEKFLGKFHKV